MEYSSWRRILPIGLRMVLNVLTILSFHVSVIASGRRPDPKASNRQALPNITPSPFLGVFTQKPQEVARLYCKMKVLDHVEGVIYWSESGKIGRVNDIRSCSNDDVPISNQKGKVVPGEFHDALGEDVSHLYTASLDPRLTEDTLSTVGLLLRPGAILLGKPERHVARFTYRNVDFIIKQELSDTCLHFKCFNSKTKKLISHFYYYLGYEVDKSSFDR